MKEPEHTSLDELGGDARIARIFRWSAIAAAILTLIVAAGLIAWWWLSRDTPVTVDEIAAQAPQPLAQPGTMGPTAPRFTDVTEKAGLDIDLYGMGVAVGDYDGDGDGDGLHPVTPSTRTAAYPILSGSNRPRLSRSDAVGRSRSPTGNN